ncbi:MAG: hypothetical protein AB7O24_07335 [Kofleriaceae bacterium]
MSARPWLLSCALALIACDPEIAPGSYACGPEQLCPEGQTCNGPDNVCVLDRDAQPFACGNTSEVEPNGMQSAAQTVSEFQCVSFPVEIKGCVDQETDEDWYRIDVPANCTAVEVDADIQFPIAFAAVRLELRASDGAVVTTAGPCDSTPPSLNAGVERQCLNAVVTPGGSYALRAVQSGDGTCGGTCAFNRYVVTAQLATP